MGAIQYILCLFLRYVCTDCCFVKRGEDLILLCLVSDYGWVLSSRYTRVDGFFTSTLYTCIYVQSVFISFGANCVGSLFR